MQLPRHRLDELYIDADSRNMKLYACQLLGAASKVNVARGGTMILVLPKPATPPFAVAQLQQEIAAAADAEQLQEVVAAADAEQLRAALIQMAKTCAYALLETFQATPSLETAQLGAERWEVGTAGSERGVSLASHTFVHIVTDTLRSHTHRFGSLRVAAGGPEHAEHEAVLLPM